MIKSLLTFLSHIGIDKETQENQFIVATNVAVILAWGITFPFMFFFYYLGYSFLFYVSLISLFLYPIVFLLNKYGFYLAAKASFILMGYTHVLLISVYTGRVSGFELIFYLMPIVSVFTFSIKEKLYMFSGILTFIPFFVLTQYLYFVYQPHYIEPVIANIFYYSSIGFVLIFIVSLFYSFKMASLNFQNSLEDQKKFNQKLLDAQEQIIITMNEVGVLNVNETFLDFFAVDSIEDFENSYGSLCETFDTNTSEGYLQRVIENEKWIDFVISHSFGYIHKVKITMGESEFIFSVSAVVLDKKEGIKLAVFTNITEQEKAKLELESAHKQTQDSIEYASLIQSTLIPDNKVFESYFRDYFILWEPKDTVGGDIYLFESLRNDDECLLMIVDCTGHGVPGAFVTMLVKAIERQIISEIKHTDKVVSPATLMSIFNANMKHLLKQENSDSISNAGFDGGILYYNKKEQIIKYAGANIPLLYIEDAELKSIQADKYSVGYKKCKLDYEYTEHTINVHEGMQFYLTTDGYVDQNGGEKGFPFGKRKFENIIKEHYRKQMSDQKEVFIKVLDEYQGVEERNDDITLIGLKI